MKSSSPLNQSVADRQLAFRTRGDLQIAPVAYSGQGTYVVKDPLTLELFHLTAAEHFLLEALRSVCSLRDLQKSFQKRFAPRQITLEALQQGLNQLHRLGLLLSHSSGQGEQLRERAKRVNRQQRLQSLFRVMSFRLGSIDATKAVDGLHRLVCWLFSWPVLLGVVSLCVYVCWILLSHGTTVWQRLPGIQELSQPKYWLLWIATIAVVKVIHELAHAVTCQRFGGRCHEMGVLLLACLPCLYCDVSDAWRFPKKWQRIAVSAAGMIAEFVLALLALILWWHTAPGLLNTWCLSVVIVCSVGTLLVNANPLLRYDGYYILSDLIDVPNLSSRSQGLLPNALQHWLVGQPQQPDPLLSASQVRGMVVYAVLARVYLLLVLLGIFATLLNWARPYRLENLVYTLGAITLLGLVYGPLHAMWKLGRNPSYRMKLRMGRSLLLLTVISAFVGFVFFWPIEQSVEGPAVFVPDQSQAIYATTAGELQEALEPGSVVEPGDVIARLENPKTELQMVQLQGEYEVRRVHFEQLKTTRAWNTRSAEQLPTAQAALTNAETQLAERTRDAKELTLRTPVAGVVIAPPDMEPEASQDEQLASWSGSPLEVRNRGSWLEPGTVVCTVGDPTQLKLLVAVDQVDVPEVQVGQRVRILVESAPVRVLEGKVLDVARRATRAKTSPSSVDPSKYHLVQVELSEQDALLTVGSRAIAKIESYRSTLGQMMIRSVRKTLRLPW